ncbi:PAS domain S-box protein [Halobellus rubicundus]|uniref:PAS domain S-box protein n=1 Tax=Halobellus rubicundus TaxID=2996466 RepID=A0ABD5M6E1_9EURY
MSDPTPQTDDTVVLVAVSNRGNRDVLVDWVRDSPGYALVECSPDIGVDGSLPEFDICLVDAPGLRAIEPEVRERRSRQQPFMPCLLVENRADAFDRLPPEIRELVDDVVTPPIDPGRLRFRIDTLSRRRRLDEELRQTEQRYRRLFELAPSPKFLVEDGAIKAMNRAAEGLLGRDREAVRGESLASFVAGEDRETLRHVLEDAPAHVSQSSARSRTVVFETDTGAAICEFSAVLTGEGDERLVLAQDLTERIERERRLDLYRRAMDEASIGITITDPSLPDNPMIYANDRFAEITGYDREEVIGRNCRFLQGADTSDETVARLRRAIDAERPVSVTILNYRKNGDPFHNALDVMPVRNAVGEVTNYLGFQRDVTESVRQQQRLSVLDRVLRHNVRNRMNVVLGYAQQLADNEDPAVRQVADRITDAGEDLVRQSESARRFRNVVDESSQTLEHRDLVAIATDAVEEVLDASPDADVRTEFPDRAVVQADESVSLGIVELIENALEHGAPPVVVRIDAGDDRTTLSVSDQGSGIPPEERNVFETDEERPTEHAGGVGLWLVRWTTERVGGQISYDASAPATVRLRFRTVCETDSDA